MRTALILMIAAALARAACIAVSSDRIVAGDLAPVAPLFQTLDTAALIGFSPLPGTQRILTKRELTAIALRHHLVISGDNDIRDVCVERDVHSLSGEDVKSALVSALGGLQANIELIEWSSQVLPVGRLEFMPAGLSKPPIASPESPVVWRGKLIYDGRRSASVWAKVRIAAERTIFTAAESIPAGSAIRADQVKSAKVKRFPFAASSLDSLDAIAGKIARQSILAGHEFVPTALEDPKEVNKGDQVHVSVVDGAASLSLSAVAGSSGKKGDTILIHNPATGRNFRAVVEEKGQVIVRPSPGE
jgi:flagellar basal body P-ring formation protein FlgA